VGLLPLTEMERYVDMALRAEQDQREVDYVRTLRLPLPWTIEKTRAEAAAEARWWNGQPRT
jgi:hypothetical protein